MRYILFISLFIDINLLILFIKCLKDGDIFIFNDGVDLIVDIL
jgi:hypothetical protein